MNFFRMIKMDFKRMFLSGIAYALLKYKMPKLPLLIGVEGIYDRNEV